MGGLESQPSSSVNNGEKIGTITLLEGRSTMIDTTLFKKGRCKCRNHDCAIKEKNLITHNIPRSFGSPLSPARSM